VCVVRSVVFQELPERREDCAFRVDVGRLPRRSPMEQPHAAGYNSDAETIVGVSAGARAHPSGWDERPAVLDASPATVYPLECR